uniref:Somatotropin n=1 Tax=Cynoglossus semilaevis TaxID=244447 RepID=B9VVQ0_CYNSE|nr:growth hormone [Cynoglossus semilaevis]
MDKLVLLLSMLCMSVSTQPVIDQRRFSIAVSKVQHLHLLAQKYFSDFENSLQTEDQRQFNKFHQDFCNPDNIIIPDNKHETQRSSVLNLLLISKRLVDSWEFSIHFITWNLFPRNQVLHRLSDLKKGIQMLIEASDGAEMSDSITLPVTPFGNFYENLGGNESQKRNYELLACFKKDMHKVETYLTVAKCRLSPEANCTL